MTVGELVPALGLRRLTQGGDLTRPVQGGYCGDLLSWVMGRAGADGAWLTIMSNRNVAAVAEMADLSCVILCEGVTPDPELQTRAEAENLALLGTEEDTFSTAGRLYALLQG